MNKVTHTLRWMNRRENKPRTLRQMFDSQKAALNALTNADYWHVYNKIIAKYGCTRERFFAIIHDPALYSFYSPGLPDEYKPVNHAIRRYCKSKGIFTPDYLITAFASHANHAVKLGQIVRHGQRGNYTYTLPKGE